MKDLLISIFGRYVPVTTQVPAVLVDTVTETVTPAEGAAAVVTNSASSVELYEVVASGLAGVDWPWIAGVFLFAVMLCGFFWVVGRLVRG